MYKKKKLEFIKEIKIKSLEKNPKNGGTPDKENNIIVIVIKEKKLNLKSLKEYIVLKLKLMYCCKFQNNINKEIL